MLNKINGYKCPWLIGPTYFIKETEAGDPPPFSLGPTCTVYPGPTLTRPLVNRRGRVHHPLRAVSALRELTSHPGGFWHRPK